MTFEEWQAMKWDPELEDWYSWWDRYYAEAKIHWRSIKVRHGSDDDLEFFQPTSPGRGDAYDWQIDKQPRQSAELWSTSHDEERDLGYDDLRAPGLMWGWELPDDMPEIVKE